MKVLEQQPNQSAGHWDAVYVWVQSGSKINAVESDSGLISSGLTRVGFFFKKKLFMHVRFGYEIIWVGDRF